MHRCYVDQPLAAGGSYALSQEEGAHVARVLRMRAGDAVELLDGQSLFSGEIESASPDGVTVRAIGELPSLECPVRLTLYQGLPKQDKLELIVQKATELGAYSVVPTVMERSIAKPTEKKADRCQKIALEAAKQAGRAHVPEIAAPAPLGRLLSGMKEHELVLVPWEDARGTRIRDAIEYYQRSHDTLPESIGILIGPEGGISPAEIDALQQIGAVPVTLGRRILRTETAGLAALAVTLAALGDM